MKAWTAKDLLYKVFEFKGMVPNSKEWDEKSLTYNLPRLIRFKRLTALLKAFELTRTEEQKNSYWTTSKGKLKEGDKTPNEIIPFLRGDFITNREDVNYPTTEKIITKESGVESVIAKTRNIHSFYHHLMKYRLEIDHVLRHNSGALEASSSGFRAAILLTGEINNTLYEKVEKIDKLLVEIISPKHLSFREDILINNYDFPKDDLDAIDIDNW